MTGSFILVNNAFANHLVDDGLGFAEAGIGRLLVVGRDSGMNFLQRGTQLRTHAGVVLTAVFRLPSALFCLSCICQGESPIYLVKKTLSKVAHNALSGYLLSIAC